MFNQPMRLGIFYTFPSRPDQDFVDGDHYRHTVDELRSKLAAMIEDRNLWKGQLNDDCPNIAKLAKLTNLEAENTAMHLELVGPPRQRLAFYREQAAELTALQAKVDAARIVFKKLACLGNGDRHGNSIGNDIAIKALADQD